MLKYLREASLFMGWGREITGDERNRSTRKGGGNKFWTTPEGGAKNFGLPPKGGQKILDLMIFFSMFLKHNFFKFFGYFGHFSFFGLRGGENFQTRREGGAQNFRRVLKGGRKILDG